MTDTITGNVDNGERGELAASFYTGPAGARAKSGGRLEIAFFGKPPRSFQPEEGTFAGRPIRILTMAESKIARGMVVVEAREA